MWLSVWSEECHFRIWAIDIPMVYAVKVFVLVMCPISITLVSPWSLSLFANSALSWSHLVLQSVGCYVPFTIAISQRVTIWVANVLDGIALKRTNSVENYSNELVQSEDLSLYHCTLRASEHRWPCWKGCSWGYLIYPDSVSASVGSRSRLQRCIYPCLRLSAVPVQDIFRCWDLLLASMGRPAFTYIFIYLSDLSFLPHAFDLSLSGNLLSAAASLVHLFIQRLWQVKLIFKQ